METEAETIHVVEKEKRDWRIFLDLMNRIRGLGSKIHPIIARTVSRLKVDLEVKEQVLRELLVISPKTLARGEIQRVIIFFAVESRKRGFTPNDLHNALRMVKLMYLSQVAEILALESNDPITFYNAIYDRAKKSFVVRRDPGIGEQEQIRHTQRFLAEYISRGEHVTDEVRGKPKRKRKHKGKAKV